MDVCHLEHAELEPKLQQYKGRVVLRGDIAKDDSGAFAVCAEQGSFASQMIVAKLTDVSAGLPGCDGQAVFAVSACTQVKFGGCSKTGYKITNRIVQMFGYVLHDMNGQHFWQTWKILSHLLNEICMVIQKVGCHGKHNSKKLCLNMDWRKYRIGNACSFIGNKCYFCQHLWVLSKLLERCRIWLQCGKDDEHVDIDEPTSFC